MRLVILLAALWAGTAAAEPRARIQLLGDSMMATHVLSGRAVPNWVARELGEDVDNKSLTGAMMRGISHQYEPGPHDWVVLNGGGNDLWLGCGCRRCEDRMSRMITPAGDAGMLPKLVARIRGDGAKVLYVGYLRSPGFGSPIEHCRDEGDEMERRVEAMARRMDGVWLLSNRALVPAGDRSFHAFDRIHPSVKGSKAIARRIVSVIDHVEAR
ncbi:MAG: SGNH/GDSL hydrolase family protein [Pseudomonadota bacterium]